MNQDLYSSRALGLALGGHMVLTIHIQCDNCRAGLQPAGASVWALAEFSL